MKRFLSIDWDYFIKAFATERSLFFPDNGNENLPQQVQSLIWDNLYYSNPKLMEFDIHRDEYKILQGILRRFYTRHRTECVESVEQFGKPLFRAAISHAFMYDFVQSFVENKDEPFEVYNVDFHHDKYHYHTKDHPVNCGNWVNVLQELYPNMKYYWIKREDSETEVLGGEVEAELDTLVNLENIEFDYVFMCRSDCWSPPHLDKYFDLLCVECSEHIPTFIDEGLCRNRVRKIGESAFHKPIQAYQKERGVE